MPNPTAAMLVIGDEILSGRTRDAALVQPMMILPPIASPRRLVTRLTCGAMPVHC